MGKNSFLKKIIPSFFICLFIGLWLLNGCATPVKTASIPEEPEVPVIENILVSTTPSGTLLELISSKPAPYTGFKLNDPPRIIIDVRGAPGKYLPLTKDIKAGNIDMVRFEPGKTEAITTRMIANLTGPIDYNVEAEDNIIKLTINPKQQDTTTQALQKNQMPQVSQTDKGMLEKDKPVTPSEPRIFLKPKTADLNNILGIDFTMLDRGKSRLIVTSDKKADYDLDRSGDKSLSVKFSNATMHELILKSIDASHFESALTSVNPSISKDKNEVALNINLREMVPFHVKQSDGTLNIDFGKTIIKPAELKITPIALAETQTRTLAAQQPGSTKSAAPMQSQKKEYRGEPMYLDFVNADVTHILRLINEISEKNIIWDPAVQGKKVSMILKNVPWDEALDLILQNNDLDRREQGDNIIWVTTKAKMKQIKAEEDAEAQKMQARIEAEEKKKQEKEEKAKEPEPLLTEYIPVDFASADEIRSHVEQALTERGSISIDTRTNTIIIKDIKGSIEEAKNTVKQFDTPVKQIMIEARIVDASSTFGRDLGVQWNSISAQRKNETGGFLPADPTTFANGGRISGGSFSTNTPSTWAGNLNLAFGRLTSTGLGAIGLDASLALAESDGTAKVISAPKVIAREGTSATISSGDSIIIAATENVASTTLDATLSLTVSPTSVSYNDFITMDVSVTDDQAPSSSRLLRKAINTTLMIKSGETVVIGGILKESEGDDTTGIPGLGDVPGLGWLFKAQSKTRSKSELMIFLTPTVLPSPVKTY